jgi:CDP-diacylglycerol--glycerol-3-phosphate 3-phosphatidyltransferase
LLDRAGMTPNLVTLLSLVPALAAGVAVAAGWFGLACVLATAASLGDTLDGLLARRHGSASDAGEAVDAVADRYVEFFFMGGLVIYYRFSLPACLLAVFALYGAFMVSYSTAKAEALDVPPPRGSMRRAERAIYLLFAAGLTPLCEAAVGRDRPLVVRHAPMFVAIGLIAVVGNVSVVLRLGAIVRLLRARDRERAAVPRINGGAAHAGTVASLRGDPHIVAGARGAASAAGDDKAGL